MLKKIKDFFLLNKSQGQTIFKNFSWLLFGQIGSRLFRILIIVYAARLLGTDEYGVFSYVLGLAGFFSIFADIGINPILTKEVAKNPSQGLSIFATSFWIKIGLLFITSLLVIFVAPFFSKIEAAKFLLPFVALLITFDGLREFSIAFFRAKERMEVEAFVTVITNLAIGVFGFIILKLSHTASAIAITYVLSSGTGFIFSIIILRKQFLSIFGAFKKDLLLPILKMAWPIALVSLVGVFMLNIDVIMLGYFKTASEVGLYSASQKIIQLLYVFSSILAVSIYPAFAKFVGEKKNNKTKELIEKGISASFLLAIPAVVGGIILGKEIITFLYGPAYVGGTLTFQILLLTLLPVFAGYHLGNYVMAYDRQKNMVGIVWAASIGNVVMNAALIPFFGSAGAAAATLLAQIILQGFTWNLAKTINNFSILSKILKIGLSAVCMGAISFALNKLGVQVIINIIASGSLYFLFLYLMKEDVLLDVKSLISPAYKVQ